MVLVFKIMNDSCVDKNQNIINTPGGTENECPSKLP